MPRMHTLTAAEHDAFNTPPVFSYAERETFFHVSESLDALLRTLRSPTNRVYLVLTVGYFRATIKLKETTASQLFRRLNSYSKQHPLYQALKEFGKIPKSDFILRFIDDVELRQAIEKQLNKSESANKFSKAISFGNNHDFLYGEKVEQEIAEGCRRLIKNAIIC
jgi:TnpA family transposase